MVGRNSVNSPVDMVNIPHYFYGFIHPRWLFEPSTVFPPPRICLQFVCQEHGVDMLAADGEAIFRNFEVPVG